MSVTEGSGIGNVRKSETGALEVAFQVVLESEKYGFSRHPPSGFEVGVNAIGVGRILLPVSDLVAVRPE
jgi:phage gp45-like